jgi:integrase/recombinase XerD
VRLRVQNLDSDRMLIRVEGGKGRKDRDTVLSDRLLAELREYWRLYRPPSWLFPTHRCPDGHLTPSAARKIYQAAKQRAGITKTGGIHSLRHAFAIVHLVEPGIAVLSIRDLLPHRDLSTTSNYIHLAHRGLTRKHSAFDLLNPYLAT